MNNYLNIINRSNLFSGCTIDETSTMLKCLNARNQKFDATEFILREGDHLHEIGLMLEGSAIIIQEDRWGNRNIVSKIGVSQSFGSAYACAPSKVLNVSVLAETKANVTFLDVKKILTVCSSGCDHHNKIIRNLISELAEKNLQLSEKLTHSGKRSTKEKVMSYLSTISKREGSSEFDIPFSRQQLADYLGVERSGLSLELSKMKKAGMIDYNKSHFVLND